MNIFGKRSDLPFSLKNDHAWFPLRMSRILFTAKHSWTIICWQLFAGHVVGFRPMKRKKILHRIIIYLTRAWVNIAFPCRKRGSKSATVFSAISRSGIGASPCSLLLASATCFWTLAVRSPVWVTTVYWNEKIITIIIKIIIWLQDWGHHIPMVWPSFLKRV